MSLEAFAERVGIDVPAEHHRQLLAEVAKGVRFVVVTERFVVAAAVMDIVAHLRIFTRLRASER